MRNIHYTQCLFWLMEFVMMKRHTILAVCDFSSLRICVLFWLFVVLSLSISFSLFLSTSSPSNSVCCEPLFWIIYESFQCHFNSFHCDHILTSWNGDDSISPRECGGSYTHSLHWSVPFMVHIQLLPGWTENGCDDGIYHLWPMTITDYHCYSQSVWNQMRSREFGGSHFTKSFIHNNLWNLYNHTMSV